MSIFTRPESPPPRQPSPEFVPAPLPSPHFQARLRKSSSKQSLSPSVPPGLHPLPVPRNLVHSSRSHEHLGNWPEGRRRTPSNPHTLSSTHRSPPTPPTSLSVDHASGRHWRRSALQAGTYHSPPPSPAIPSPPPPVPPIPAFVAAEVKHKVSPPMSKSPICLPDFDNVAVSTRQSRQQPKLPPLQNHSGIGMTCLKFFSTRNTKRKV